MEDSQQNFAIPLKDIIAALVHVVKDAQKCMKESGLLASEYEQAGRQFELMRDVNAELKRGLAAELALAGVGQLLALTSLLERPWAFSGC